LAFWHFGILAFWHFGILAFWHFGILACWPFGILAFWYVGHLAFWHFVEPLKIVIDSRHFLSQHIGSRQKNVAPHFKVFSLNGTSNS
jgi:hypothetical protein